VRHHVCLRRCASALRARISPATAANPRPWLHPHHTVALARILRVAHACCATADPDDIFSNVETCDLVDIFAPPGKPTKERYHRRGSSGNWKADQLTWREVHEYNQAMGYYKGEHG